MRPAVHDPASPGMPVRRVARVALTMSTARSPRLRLGSFDADAHAHSSWSAVAKSPAQGTSQIARAASSVATSLRFDEQQSQPTLINFSFPYQWRWPAQRGKAGAGDGEEEGQSGQGPAAVAPRARSRSCPPAWPAQRRAPSTAAHTQRARRRRRHSHPLTTPESLALPRGSSHTHEELRGTSTGPLWLRRRSHSWAGERLNVTHVLGSADNAAGARSGHGFLRESCRAGWVARRAVWASLAAGRFRCAAALARDAWPRAPAPESMDAAAAAGTGDQEAAPPRRPPALDVSKSTAAATLVPAAAPGQALGRGQAAAAAAAAASASAAGGTRPPAAPGAGTAVDRPARRARPGFESEPTTPKTPRQQQQIREHGQRLRARMRAAWRAQQRLILLQLLRQAVLHEALSSSQAQELARRVHAAHGALEECNAGAVAGAGAATAASAGGSADADAGAESAGVDTAAASRARAVLRSVRETVWITCHLRSAVPPRPGRLLDSLTGIRGGARGVWPAHFPAREKALAIEGAERDASAALLRCVHAISPEQTRTQLAAKRAVLSWLAGILRAWVADVRAALVTAESNALPGCFSGCRTATRASGDGDLFVGGSHILGVDGWKTDIDVVWLAPHFVRADEHFFFGGGGGGGGDGEHDLSLARRLLAMPEVEALLPVDEAAVPIINLKVRLPAEHEAAVAASLYGLGARTPEQGAAPLIVELDLMLSRFAGAAVVARSVVDDDQTELAPVACADAADGSGMEDARDAVRAAVALEADVLPRDLRIDDDDAIAHMDSASLLALNGPRTATLLLALVPDAGTFRATLKALRTWAVARGVYSHRHGYLSGINLAVLCAYVCQELPNASPALLLARFFEV
eukprot:g5552.t1